VAWAVLIAGFVIGIGVAGFWCRRRTARRGSRTSFRPAPDQRHQGDPYRGEVAAPPSHTLATLTEAVRTPTCDVRSRADGFDLRSGGHSLELRVDDPANVTLASIELVDHDNGSMIFELALALVPLYGPIVVTEALWGAFVVDGRRDATALREDRAGRIRELARSVAARIDSSRPLWDELAKREP